VLYASSPTHPGTFYLGDRAKRQLAPFAERYPQLKGIQLAGKTKVHYPSKDGLSIDGYLTLPVTRKEGQRLPAIVFPHGGPAARTLTTFDYWTEFFANRGYAVLEMDFRGSSGQGFEWMASAFANWDQITQQDIADGARYLVSEGIADPKRICIVGASFGGYAALTGAVKYPGLYKCAVSIAGVSDLVELRNRSRGFLNSEQVEAQIGHDSDRLREASPIRHAEAITQPVLLIHGKTDRVVEVGQSQAMYAELTKLDKPAKYVELESGDHYLSNYFDRVAAFKAMDEFLKQNL
jgi:dipeptidyl aminopeptidase/acylaminoacyl peptidase